MVYCLLIVLIKLIIVAEQIMCIIDLPQSQQQHPFKLQVKNSADQEHIASAVSFSAPMYRSQRHFELTRLRKSTLSRPPSVEECIADQFNYAILRGCLCYLFQSTGQSNGTFMSPQLDFVQSKQITCLLFTFVGDLNEIVRMEFTHFLLDPKENPTEVSLECQSYVRIFDSLERAELNQNDRENFRLCGSERNLPQRIYYSAGRVLVVEVHLSWQYSSPIDIRGSFRFESKDLYQSSGTPIVKSVCDQIFLSPAISSNGFKNMFPKPTELIESGVFFSPGFPRNYPVNTTCTYYFIGAREERVSIALMDVRLDGPDQCTTTERHDRIEIRDLDVTAQITESGPVDHHTKAENAAIKPIAVICGKVSHTHFLSDGSSVTLRFVANDRRGVGNAGGFRGRFGFVVAGNTRLTTRQFDSKDHVADQSEQLNKIDQGMMVKHIKPDPHRLSDVLESPNYPRPYPDNLQLLYVFHIPSEMRIRIKFFDFRFDDHNPNSCTISNADRLEVYNGPYPGANKELVLCGPELPATLFQKYPNSGELTSTGDIFTLRLVTNGFRLGNERGFVLSYAYTQKNLSSNMDSHRSTKLTDTFHSKNVGWTSEDEGDCQYIISSNGKEDVGHIWIGRYVNTFPGNVTNTEGRILPNCRWRLRGKPGQRISLKLVRITPSQTSPEQRGETSQVQYDEQFRFDKNIEHSGLRSKINADTSSYLSSLKCHTPISVELVNYRPALDQSDQEFRHMEDLSREWRYGSRQYVASDSSVSSDDSTIPVPSSHSNSRVEPSDPIRLCADESVNKSPAARGFMSGNVPQLDVILRLDTPVFNEQFSGASWKYLVENSNLNYDIQYRFVTDYGVIAPFGYQRKPGCFFEFNRSQSLKGNFSSPNYPGLYPIDLVCEYRFSGANVKKIGIEFLAFDVESASKTCTDDRLGDYVELRSCYPIELISYPKRRLCHKQSDHNPYRIEWFESCLILRFFSNEMFVRTGFLGQYEFHTSGYRILVPCSHLCWFSILAVRIFHLSALF